MESTLPPSLTDGATLQGNELGWTIAAFPKALEEAKSLGFACLGGQFQFRLSDGTYEMYWLNADSDERRVGETWLRFVHRSCYEVATGFMLLVQQTDFHKQAWQWPLLRSSLKKALDGLVFEACFVSEEKYSSLQTQN